MDDKTGQVRLVGGVDAEVIALAQAPQGRLWVGTTQGLQLVDPDLNQVVDFADRDRFVDTMVRDMREDAAGQLWIKTNKQLHIYNPASQQFCALGSELGEIAHIFPWQGGMLLAPPGREYEWLKVAPGRQGCQSMIYERIALPFAKLEPLLVDSRQQLWAAAPEGVVRLTSDLKSHRRFTVNDGLPNNTVYGALQDDSGQLWFSTNGGLSRFDPSDESFANHTRQDGLQSDEFNGEAAVKRRNGELVFAGMNGLNRFDPARLRIADKPPRVHVTTLTVLEKSPSAQEVRLLRNGMVVALVGEQNDIELAFTAIHLLDPTRNRFRFRLVGLEKNWTETDSEQRVIRYTNLNPGDYRLEVMAANAHGVWSEAPVWVDIHIAKQWWQTWWAKLGLIFGGLVILYLLVGQWRLVLSKRHAQQLFELVEARTADIEMQKDTIEEQMEALKTLDNAKDRFFENISHEFRTPLALIIGPLRQLSRDSGLANKLEAPIRQASRLLRLINQLLEISRMNAGALKLNLRTYRCAEQIRQVAIGFKDILAAKDLQLELALDDDILLTYDAQAMDKILVNLLSNAVNYTPAGGKITIQLSQNGHWAVIAVQDSGVGIAPQQLDKIFGRFEQAGHSHEFQHGLGVGLALVKELVEWQGGRIAVQSTQHQGSCFTLQLPLGSAGGDEQPLDVPDELSDVTLAAMAMADGSVEEEDGLGHGTPADGWTVLVIDDEPDMRRYLGEVLQAHSLLWAVDGEQGLKLAIEAVPDLIVSDVMMPRMDGLTLVRALRENPVTSHIPIILLTAKGGRDSRLAGLDEGVEDYIVKPFDEAELQLRVRNLLAIRSELAKRAAREEQPQQAVAIPRADQAFLARYREVLQQCYGNPECTVEDLAKAMHMEKRQLQRKLRAILDTTPTDDLRAFRLEQAAKLLLAGESVSTAMNQCGFNAMAHFSRCFKVRFGVSPSQYRAHVQGAVSPVGK